MPIAAICLNGHARSVLCQHNNLSTTPRELIIGQPRGRAPGGDPRLRANAGAGRPRLSTRSCNKSSHLATAADHIPRCALGRTLTLLAGPSLLASDTPTRHLVLRLETVPTYGGAQLFCGSSRLGA